MEDIHRWQKERDWNHMDNVSSYRSGEKKYPIDFTEYRPGWQFIITHAADRIRYNQFLANMSSGERAIHRSCAGPHSTAWLHAIPYEDDLIMDDVQFRCSVSRRLGVPITAISNSCSGCGRRMDAFGYQGTTCMRTGNVQRRHKCLRDAWRRIFHENGISISRRNREWLLLDTHLRTNADDRRRMDLMIAGILGIFKDSPLFMGVTYTSSIHGNVRAMTQTGDHDYR